MCLGLELWEWSGFTALWELLFAESQFLVHMHSLKFIIKGTPMQISRARSLRTHLLRHSALHMPNISSASKLQSLCLNSHDLCVLCLTPESTSRQKAKIIVGLTSDVSLPFRSQTWNGYCPMSKNGCLMFFLSSFLVIYGRRANPNHHPMIAKSRSSMFCNIYILTYFQA